LNIAKHLLTFVCLAILAGAAVADNGPGPEDVARSMVAQFTGAELNSVETEIVGYEGKTAMVKADGNGQSCLLGMDKAPPHLIGWVVSSVECK
jgi:hypothetical protein